MFRLLAIGAEIPCLSLVGGGTVECKVIEPAPLVVAAGFVQTLASASV
ncbi:MULTISPECIES: hypothetical protein [Streptomyces]|uniref:Uncharacterized protein n=1 Tax=Streptomyces melanosporofaciens TaxID=67327 RepID=A0A1H4I8C9_STRMJ|nr:hypothetical protein [Streptomyces melanosporofaciens]SEB29532.1 hypothetical protein SAMN04490356_0052 [Streptomyces melanosporofaciens]